MLSKPKRRFPVPDYTTEPNKSKIPNLHPEILDDISNGPTKNSDTVMNPTSLVLSAWTLKIHAIFFRKKIYLKRITYFYLMSKNLYVIIVDKINKKYEHNYKNDKFLQVDVIVIIWWMNDFDLYKQYPSFISDDD